MKKIISAISIAVLSATVISPAAFADLKEEDLPADRDCVQIDGQWFCPDTHSAELIQDSPVEISRHEEACWNKDTPEEHCHDVTHV